MNIQKYQLFLEGETPEVGPMCRYDGARRASDFRIFSQLEKLMIFNLLSASGTYNLLLQEKLIWGNDP